MYLIQSMYGLFQNPYDMQIPKLSSGVHGEKMENILLQTNWDVLYSKQFD